jgi:hypothetical protein
MGVEAPVAVSVSGSGFRHPRLDEGDQIARPVADAPRADLDRHGAEALSIPTLKRRDRDAKELRGVGSRAQTVRLGGAEVLR